MSLAKRRHSSYGAKLNRQTSPSFTNKRDSKPGTPFRSDQRNNHSPLTVNVNIRTQTAPGKSSPKSATPFFISEHAAYNSSRMLKSSNSKAMAAKRLMEESDEDCLLESQKLLLMDSQKLFAEYEKTEPGKKETVATQTAPSPSIRLSREKRKREDRSNRPMSVPTGQIKLELNLQNYPFVQQIIRQASKRNIQKQETEMRMKVVKMIKQTSEQNMKTIAGLAKPKPASTFKAIKLREE